MARTNNYFIGQLLYRTDEFKTNSDYYIITDIENDIIYVNPIHDLKGNWFVHDVKDMSKMYRKTTKTEQVLYGTK